jgi:hypothetical protein
MKRDPGEQWTKSLGKSSIIDRSTIIWRGFRATRRLTHIFVFVITAIVILCDVITMAITILVPVGRIIWFAVARVAVPVSEFLRGVHFDIAVVSEYYGNVATTITVMRGRRIVLIHFFHALFRFIAITFSRLYYRSLYWTAGSRRDAVRGWISAFPMANLHVRTVHHFDELTAFEHEQEILIGL